MYGTIMRARVKKGGYEGLERLFEAQREELGRTDGFHSVEFAREDKDPDRIVGIIHFRDRESYVRNAQRPETNRNYEEMIKFFEGPPEWIDVDYRRYFGRSVGEQTGAVSQAR